MAPSRATSHIYGYSFPDHEYLGRVCIGNPAWITTTPDSKFLWVGVSGHNETAVVDIEKQEVIGFESVKHQNVIHSYHATRLGRAD